MKSKKKKYIEIATENAVIGFEPEVVSAADERRKRKALLELRKLLVNCPFIEDVKKEKMSVIADRFDLMTVKRLKESLMRENLRYLHQKTLKNG